MKAIYGSLVCCAVVAASHFALAQTSPTTAPAAVQSTPTVDDFKPSSLNQPGQQYPQVNSEGFARFPGSRPECAKGDRECRPRRRRDGPEKRR